MKTMSKLILLPFIILGFITFCSAQDFKKIPEKERNKIMIDSAKKVILRYGEEAFYNGTVPQITLEKVFRGKNKGRSYYQLVYYYDTTKIRMEEGYLVCVCFWEETGEVFEVTYGTAIGLGKREMQMFEERLKKGEKVPKVKFETLKPRSSSTF